MRETVDCEVVIAGGGPAGLSAWLHLQALAPDLAARTILLEKDTYPRDKLCGGGVTAIGDLLLGGLGIRIECPTVPIHRVEFRFADAVEALTRPHAMRVVRRMAFDHALAEAAVARGLDLRQGEAFVTATPSDGGLRVTSSRGQYVTRALIGADGARSAVRQALGLADPQRLARLIEVVGPVDPRRAPEFRGPTAIFDFSPLSHGVQGYVWHFPCVDAGVPMVNRGIYDSRIRPKRGRADLRAVLATALADAGAPGEMTEWRSHPVRWFSPSGRFSSPHVLLIGDAAGVDAFLGEGIAPSLDYGDLAAHAVIDAFERADFTFASFPERLFAHPVGRLLAARHQLAAHAYDDGLPIARLLPSLLTHWAAGQG